MVTSLAKDDFRHVFAYDDGCDKWAGAADGLGGEVQKVWLHRQLPRHPTNRID